MTDNRGVNAYRVFVSSVATLILTVAGGIWHGVSLQQDVMNKQAQSITRLETQIEAMNGHLARISNIDERVSQNALRLERHEGDLKNLDQRVRRLER